MRTLGDAYHEEAHPLESTVLYISVLCTRTFNGIKIVYPRPYPEKFGNAALFLRLNLPSTLICHENALPIGGS